MKKRNSGVTFLELILTLAIASVLSGVAIYSLQYTRSTNMKACVNNINSALDRVRIVSMTKEHKPKLFIYKDGGKYYMKQAVDILPLSDGGSVISSDDVIIRGVILTSPVTYCPVDDANYLTVEFNRSNGSVVTTPLPCALGQSPGYDYIEILDQSGIVKYRIHLVGLTGKHFIEKF